MSGIVDTVRDSLRTLSTTLSWAPVSLRGLDIAWVGMAVPAVDSGGRPWVWEVVTPHDFGAMPHLCEDPMVLPVVQDTVVVSVSHADHSGPLLRMQVPVSETPEHVVVDHDLLPGEPWNFSLETGWTTEALKNAAQGWIDTEAGGAARLESLEAPAPREETYGFSSRINIQSSAMDRLLTLHPDDSAAISGALSHIHEALEPFR
jgi:hypothetical protein